MGEGHPTGEPKTSNKKKTKKEKKKTFFETKKKNFQGAVI